MLIKHGGQEKIHIIENKNEIDDTKTAEALKVARESVKKLSKDGNKTESNTESIEYGKFD